MTILHWWEVDPTRLVLEYLEVNRRHTGFSIALDDDRHVVVGGNVAAAIADIAGARMSIAIRCPAGFPAVAPSVVDVNERIPPDRWGSHYWHVNLDGSICFAAPRAWSPQYMIADVIDKVADWIHNTVALEAGLVDAMPSTGRVELPGGEAS